MKILGFIALILSSMSMGIAMSADHVNGYKVAFFGILAAINIRTILES